VLCSAFACGTKKNIESPVVKQEVKPEWMMSRPVNGAYYIGIGSCSKISQPLDYQTIAQKNAFNDLASGIKVNVQGSTFLNSLEINKNFSEEFISSINTTTNESLENYEIAGQWEDKNEFWIYYRLSKAEYARQKAEKKNNALSKAFDFYQRGLELEKKTEINAAVNQYLRAIISIKEYWNENNDFLSDGGSIPLDKTIYSAILRNVSGLSLAPESNSIILNADNQYKQDLSVLTLYQGKMAKSISFTYSYPKKAYSRPKLVTSDDVGNAVISIDHADPAKKSATVDLKVDLESFIPKDLDRSICVGLLSAATLSTRTVSIQIDLPSFWIDSSEKAEDGISSARLLADGMTAALLNQGFKAANKASDATYHVFIDAMAGKASQNQGFFMSYLNANIQLTNTKTGEKVYSNTLSNVKGVQLNPKAAADDAYKKAKEKIETDLVGDLINSIF
jgi:hypothetical protein